MLHIILVYHFHQDNTPCNSYTLIPYLYIYCKTEVYKGVRYFLSFALKHILRVLVRTDSLRRLSCVRTINVSSKKKQKKNKTEITFCHLKIVVLQPCILHRRGIVMSLVFLPGRDGWIQGQPPSKTYQGGWNSEAVD